MKKKKLNLTRREVIAAGFAAMGGILLPGCKTPELPPTYGHLLRMGDNLTYLAHRTLLPGQALVREYNHGDISSFPATGTIDPGKNIEEYAKLKEADFTGWRLSVTGLVARPGSYSLDDIMRMPSQKQITRHTCEEGWTAIAEWEGVPLRRFLQIVGIQPSARYVNFYAYDGYADAIDMVDALHPQTMLAYGMNGKKLPIPHGAPLRLRLETQIGYKSMKYLSRIEVSDKFDDMGDAGSIKNGWAWYNGI